MGKTGKRPAKPKGNGRPASAKKPTPGCYVLSLTVENIRCFGPKQTLDCSDGQGRPRQWTVILGDNGTGKTTLLHIPGCATSLGQLQLGSFFSIREQHSKQTRLLTDFVVGGLADPPQFQFQFSATITVTGKEHDATASIKWEQVSSCDEQFYEPLWALFGYGANRAALLRQAGDVREHAISVSELPFTDEPQHLVNVESWLIALDYSESKSKHAGMVRWFNSVKDMLINILPDVQDIRCSAGSGSFPRAFVEFLTPYGWVKLSRLGHGYQTMIAWVADLVNRMVERYPESENPLAEPAVCLVDEIDLHLHPVWQRKVIGYLSERFPNTQFIVTAHSPLVVQAAASANANIAVLVRSTEKDADGNHYVEIKNNPEDVRNWRLDQILTSDLFGGLSLNPPNVEDLFKEKEHLLALSRLTPKQKERLAEIDTQVAGLPVGDDAREVKEMQAIREALAHLQKRSHK